MNKVEIFYKKVIETVCKECGTDPVMMFSNNKSAMLTLGEWL